nr:RNA polymerase sigma factor [Cellulomonas sp. URHD0024]
MGADGDGRRLADLWEQYAGRVQAYALRHVDGHASQEVVSETFLIAWRRLEDVPSDPLPWLLVVARNTISNQRRSHHRARGLEREMARVAHLAQPSSSSDQASEARATALGALAALSAKEREALLLVAWDGLSGAQAATVAGCSIAAFKVRLSRARRHLTSAIEVQDAPELARTDQMTTSSHRSSS